MTSGISSESINSEIDRLYWQLKMTYSRLRLIFWITRLALIASIIHIFVSLNNRAYLSDLVLQALIVLGLILFSVILFRRIIYIRGYFE